MSWKRAKLSEVTEYITDGDHQPVPKSDSGVLFVKIKDIQNNQIVFDNALFVPQEYYDRLPQNRKAVSGDTLYTVVGSYGIPAFVNHDIPFCFERNIALLHPSVRVVPEYLYYAVKNPVFYEYANNIANGSAQKLIPLSKLAGMEIAVPSIETQRKVVDILSAYDNLIANNQKQIKLLEEAARRLYKEWFVNLRFPGHETTPITDGIPEGWTQCCLDDVIAFNPKVTLNKERLKQSVPMAALDTTSMVLNTDEFTTTLSNSGSKFQNGDTLLARITPCLQNGKTAFVSGIESEEGAVGSTEFIVMRSSGLSPYMVYLLARDEEFRQEAINTMTGSDGRQRAQVDKLKMLPYIKPTLEIVELFEKCVTPMFAQIQIKNKQNTEFKQARDRLLPKLMNGEIEV